MGQINFTSPNKTNQNKNWEGKGTSPSKVSPNKTAGTGNKTGETHSNNG